MAERQLNDGSICKDVKITGKGLADLVDKINKIFPNLERRNIIQVKEKNYFKFSFKKASNVRKFYFLPKIPKSLRTPATAGTSGNFKLWNAYGKFFGILR